MGPRFALRWTAIALACFLPALAIAFFLHNLAIQQPQPQQRPRVSIDLLMTAAEMPLDAAGGGTQIISGTTVTFKLQPYPPVSFVTSTVTLMAVAPDGKPATAASPVLYVTRPGEAGERQFLLESPSGGAYFASGVFFPSSGTWRLRIDVNVGDDVPAMMLLTLNAK